MRTSTSLKKRWSEILLRKNSIITEWGIELKYFRRSISTIAPFMLGNVDDITALKAS